MEPLLSRLLRDVWFNGNIGDESMLDYIDFLVMQYQLVLTAWIRALICMD